MSLSAAASPLALARAATVSVADLCFTAALQNSKRGVGPPLEGMCPSRAPGMSPHLFWRTLGGLMARRRSPCPHPCASPHPCRHSATVVDRQLIIFGGWDAPTVYNDVYALDLLLMEFKRLTPSGTPPPPRCGRGTGQGGGGGWPRAADACKAPLTLCHFFSCCFRSWHIAIPMTVNGHSCILVHGGYDGDQVRVGRFSWRAPAASLKLTPPPFRPAQALNDVYLLDLDDMAWRPYEHSIFASPRAGVFRRPARLDRARVLRLGPLSCSHLPLPTGHTAAILGDHAHVFGGGDNEGRFFNSFDMLPLAAQ